MFSLFYLDTLHGPREADIMNRHIGDLGNVTADEHGLVVVEMSDGLIDLYNATRSIGNRTIVLHAMRDDGGKGGFPDSNSTGY
jgi:Cu-Zn family superoxide dismutase